MLPQVELYLWCYDSLSTKDRGDQLGKDVPFLMQSPALKSRKFMARETQNFSINTACGWWSPSELAFGRRHVE